MAIITLTTDLGIKDGGIASMKGVILKIAPNTQIIDLSNSISPQDIQEAAMILFKTVFYFPDGTIHVVVVDPGVGTARWPVAGTIGKQFFVGPDNGVFSLLEKYACQNGLVKEFIVLDKKEFWLPQISTVFHGRDIFAPVAAHLAAGVALKQMGSGINTLVALDVKDPERTATGWKGEVLFVDTFGNIITNISKVHIGDCKGVKILIGGILIDSLIRTFGEKNPGDLVALFGSTNNLCISVVNGSAEKRLCIAKRAIVEVEVIE